MKIVLLAAGFGSRLWPLSTSDKPKQFQPLLEERSLLQYTYDLFRPITKADDLYVLTLKGLEHWVYKQLPQLPHSNVLIVPERRNTLPHTLFALNTITDNPEESVLFSGTDLVVSEPKAFLKTVKDVAAKPDSSVITMFLSAHGAVDSNAGYALLDEQHHIKQFLEKPSKATIKALSKPGNLHKNTFCYITSSKALALTLDEQARGLLTATTEKRDRAFLAMPFCDISSTVFQKASNLVGAVAESDFVDLGTFRELYRMNPKDRRGNSVSGNVIVEPDCRDNLIINHTDQPLVVIGMHGCIVVQTQDGSLCAPIAEADRIGDIYKHQIHVH
jgi:mannose-1-phosphate guanylyltransferase